MTINLWVYCFVCILVLGYYPAVALAQFGSGFEQNSLSGAAVADAPISFALGLNPGALDGSSVHWYSARPFGIKELQYAGFSGVITHNNISLGSDFSYMGFDLYKEMIFNLGVAYQFERIRVGMSIGSEFVHIPEYGNGSKYMIGFGYHASITDNLSVGGSINQISIVESGDFKLDQQTKVLSGFKLKLNGSVSVLGAINLRDRLEPDWIWAVSMLLFDRINVNAGFDYPKSEWMIGIAFKIKNIISGGTLKNHPFLGWSQGFGMGYKFN
ncbi:MAG TPA: hypothetical protein DCE78_02720 [Bacteroidetes bacterium]|nr:hypothetical protein [Bacteroidota bacterium]